MDRKLCRRAAAALLMIMMLFPMFTAGAESTAEATEKPAPAVTHTPAELQAQGIYTVGAKGDEVTRLQQRLQQLDEWLKNGLIDKQEYQALRARAEQEESGDAR